MSKSRDILVGGLIFVLILVLFIANLTTGSAEISINEVFDILKGEPSENPAWSYIVESRLNRSITAILAGGALALAGLILQVFFRNPLAGPGVLGITSGASLGIATVMLGGISIGGLMGNIGLIAAGTIGAMVVLFLLLIISKMVRNAVTLLVAGLMFGYFASAFINILYLWADENETRQFVLWGLGSFDGLSNMELLTISLIIILISIICLFLVKALNALVLGVNYASSVGVDVKKTRLVIILVTGILASIVTVYCGPIGFVGIAVPQVIRFLVQSKNHAVILPITFLGGSLLAITADFIVRQSGNGLPLNTVTSLIGAPIIVWVIINMNRRNAQF